jgi:hypothetical protein
VNILLYCMVFPNELYYPNCHPSWYLPSSKYDMFSHGSSYLHRYQVASPPLQPGSTLDTFLAAQEQIAQALGQYDYGELEYPYMLPAFMVPDITTEAH